MLSRLMALSTKADMLSAKQLVYPTLLLHLKESVRIVRSIPEEGRLDYLMPSPKETCSDCSAENRSVGVSIAVDQSSRKRHICDENL